MTSYITAGVLCLALCSVTHSYDSPPSNIEVERPPYPYSFGSYSVLMDGRNEMRLYCTADGTPEPTFRWEFNAAPLRDDPRITDEDGVLTIREPTRGDEGNYQCLASNKHGTALSPVYKAIFAYQQPFDKFAIIRSNFNEGDEAILECEAPEGAPKPRVYWTDSTSIKNVETNDRISYSTEGHLHFAHVLESDEGGYYCFVVNDLLGSFMRSPLHNLRVNSGDGLPREATISSLPTRVSGLRTETFIIKCLASGFPTPLISWFKNDQELPGDDSGIVLESFNHDLVFTSLEFEDAGSYECRASNTENTPPATGTVHLTVNSAPYFITAPQDLVIAPGDSSEINCNLGGVPDPTQQWLQNGAEIRDSASSVYEVSGTKIIINNVQEGDSTVFQCIAENIHGLEVGSFTITVLAIPATISLGPIPRETAFEGTSFQLDCSTFGSPTPTVQWHKDGVKLESGGRIIITEENDGATSHLNVSDLVLDDAGTYECHALNSVDNDMQSSEISVRYSYLLLCEGQRKYVSCSNGATINVVTAAYGYNRSNEEARQECYEYDRLDKYFRDLNSTNCHQPDSTNIVADMCNGLSECTVIASNEIFGDPCRGVIKFLELYYHCVQLSDIVTTGLPDEKDSRGEDAVTDLSNRKRNSITGDGELNDNSSKEIDNVDDGVGLSPVSVVSVVAVLIAFTATVIFVRLVLCLGDERSCICTKCKKSDREEFKSNDTRGKHNTCSFDMEYEVVGNDEYTLTTDSNQSPHYETSIHVTSAIF